MSVSGYSTHSAQASSHTNVEVVVQVVLYDWTTPTRPRVTGRVKLELLLKRLQTGAARPLSL